MASVMSLTLPARHHLNLNVRRFFASLKIRAVKFTIYTIFIFLFTAIVAATAEDSVSPQFRAAIVCYNGKLDSGSSCAVNPASAGQPLAKSGKMTCGFPGRASEITWSFVERRDGNDVYSFTRRFPIETPETATETKQIKFGGERLTVFEDKFQVIVIQSPKK